MVRFCFPLLGLSLITAVASLVYPIYVIRPFRRQGEAELMLALWVSHWRTALTLVCALVAVAALGAVWSQLESRLGKGLAIAATLLVFICTGLARVSLYEQMFHPNANPAFAPVRESGLDADEKVIAVKVGGAARAYPIRAISYHHVINDEVDSKAIVATY